MKICLQKYSLLFFFTLLIYSCKTSYVVKEYAATTQKVNAELASNSPTIDSIIAPYKKSLDAEMNRVLVVNEKAISKHGGESELGNLLADITYQKAIKYGKQPVDFAIVNLGGIRIPQLPAGDITLGKVYELMPFDNAIVIVELNGNETKQFFDIMAKEGGIPIANAKYTIKDGKAIDIFINGVELTESSNYKIALSDYLANGGDNLSLFIGKKQIATNKLLRDAFIEAFEELGSRNKTIKIAKEGRVSFSK